MVFFVLLLVVKRSDRSRKRRPAKIVSFDTDDTGTNSSPASGVASPTTLTSSVCNIAVSAKTQMSRELDHTAVDILKALSDDSVSSSHGKAVRVASLPSSGTEPYVSCTADKTVSLQSTDIVNKPSDGLALPKRCASIIVESEFSKHRTSSLPNMTKNFSAESYNGCSEDLNDVSSEGINIFGHSSSSTVKPDDFEGPQDLPSDNAWFGAFRERVSSVNTADAESIGSNASSASSSSVNNPSRFVSCFVLVGFSVLKLQLHDV